MNFSLKNLSLFRVMLLFACMGFFLLMSAGCSTLNMPRDAEAQFELGLSYYDGTGVSQDYKQAVKWYTLAAEQEYSPAQFNLALCYKYGEGVPQDYTAAVQWFTALNPDF